MIGHPLVAWVLFTISLYALYFSPLFDLTLRNQLVHDLVHLHFLAVGLLFWWPLVGLDPSRWRLPHIARLLFVFLMVPFHAFLGVAIMNSGRVLAPTLESFQRSWGPTPAGRPAGRGGHPVGRGRPDRASGPSSASSSPGPATRRRWWPCARTAAWPVSAPPAGPSGR